MPGAWSGEDDAIHAPCVEPESRKAILAGEVRIAHAGHTTRGMVGYIAWLTSSTWRRSQRLAALVWSRSCQSW